jgi:hypothetical protein
MPKFKRYVISGTRLTKKLVPNAGATSRRKRSRSRHLWHPLASNVRTSRDKAFENSGENFTIYLQTAFTNKNWALFKFSGIEFDI